jgi:hypothetical protein
MEHYRNKQVTIVGDSGGGFVDAPAGVIQNLGTLDLLPDWLPAYRALTADAFHTASIFTIPARAYPANTFALVDTWDDSAQSGILANLGGAVTLKDVLEANLKELHSAAPNIRSFTGPGDHHCLTLGSSFYEFESNGVRLHDWIDDLSVGKTVEDVIP